MTLLARNEIFHRSKTFAPATGFSIPNAHLGTMRERTPGLYELVASRLDAAHYLTQLGPGGPPIDPVAHYLLVGERLGFEPMPSFSPDYYRAKHACAPSPFEHFVRVGESLGLRGKPDLESMLRPGRRPLRTGHDTLLVCGTPADVATLAQTFDVIVCIAGDHTPGDRERDATALFVRMDGSLDASDLAFVLRELKRRYALRALLFDATLPALASAALHAHIPSVAVLREDARTMRPGYYAEIVEFADLAIATSEELAETIAIDVYEARGGAARNVVISGVADAAVGGVFLERALERAAASRGDLLERAAAVVASCDFDATHHEGATEPLSPPDTWAAALTYASRATKGLVCCNPRPGLHEGVRAVRGVPLGTQTRSEDTHRCSRMAEVAPEANIALRVALHLHLYYAELADEFRAAIDATAFPIDVIATTSSDADARTIERAFAGYARGSLTLVLVPNRGRDIAPFVAVGELLQNGTYDVVGHLHGKRSLEADPTGRTGDAWRRFHIETLLGDADYFATVLSLFAREPELGLVFPEDRHAVGWQLNEPLAADLVARLAPPPSLPSFPIFPIGTAFWARPQALAPLWALQLAPDDFPPEPLPYDCTLPHAIECVLPTICEGAGFRWSTVYRAGFAW